MGPSLAFSYSHSKGGKCYRDRYVRYGLHSPQNWSLQPTTSGEKAVPWGCLVPVISMYVVVVCGSRGDFFRKLIF